MKAVVWMGLACAASWAVLAGFGGGRVPAAVWFGAIGPLVSAVVSWLLIERAARMRPETLSRLLLVSFFAKMVFFAIYVVTALALLQLDPVPFVVSFTCYFIGLHVTEALLLKQLTSQRRSAVRL
jgi:hypothetical protein